MKYILICLLGLAFLYLAYSFVMLDFYWFAVVEYEDRAIFCWLVFCLVMLTLFFKTVAEDKF